MIESRISVELDPLRLLELSLDVQAYGRTLTAMLFAEPRFVSVWDRAVGYANGRNAPLRLRIELGNDASELARNDQRHISAVHAAPPHTAA
jgi:hypothetical protein